MGIIHWLHYIDHINFHYTKRIFRSFLPQQRHIQIRMDFGALIPNPGSKLKSQAVFAQETAFSAVFAILNKRRLAGTSILIVLMERILCYDHFAKRKKN